jgi:ribulose-phosphate 3-epimerase
MRITPSILNADLARLADEIGRIPSSDMVHLDVMDGHFVPNLTFGIAVVESIRASTTLLLDAHLMIEDPDLWAPRYAEFVDSVTFHVEAARDPSAILKAVRERGSRAAFALKPATSIEPYADLIQQADMVLIMTVEPGFGGQGFMHDMMEKVRRTRALIGNDKSVYLQVDGGVSLDTIAIAAEAGADTFVAGSAIFKASDPDAMIAQLRKKAHSY